MLWRCMEESGDKADILFVGTYPPRECGIATFTRDISSAIQKKFYASVNCKILAMNRNGINIYNYPQEVIYQLSDTEERDYELMARKINNNKKIKLVCIQHEFGIFGGDYGEYLLKFLEVLEKPCVITFHSVIPGPDEKLREVVRNISKNVQEIIVMNELAIDILREDYEVANDIKVIPHGIPSVSFSRPNRIKKRLGYQNKIVLSSFGMIGPGKGYEKVIEALPKVVEKFPNLLYLIIGETHPVVRKNEGEKYRNFLESKVKDLGIQNNVKFYNKYASLKEIIKFLCASDIYLSPSTNPNQITSGTLSYAMGCGRAIVSTPFLHAKEIVNKDRGLLTKFDDADSFSNAILNILNNHEMKSKMETNNYSFTRKMTWPNSAISYKELFEKYIKFPTKHEAVLPKLNVYHLRRLTDKFGIIQFTKYLVPDRNSGYTLDDNARGLIVATMLYNKHRKDFYLRLVKTYLNYIEYVQQSKGKLYNYVDKKKNINLDNFSEEAHARALRALGYLISHESVDKNLRKRAEVIFNKGIGIVEKFQSPRAMASSIGGLYYYNKENYSERNIKLISSLADKLVHRYNESSHEGWHWFEPYLTYSNGKLSESLFYAYMTTRKKEYLEVGTMTLNFLISETFDKNSFVPVGQEGWHKKNGKRSYYDQQPVEAVSTIFALLAGYKVLKNPLYLDYSRKAFQWFLGKNRLNQTVYNEFTGGCHDGLGQDAINLNQGAESTLVYLMARLSLERF